MLLDVSEVSVTPESIDVLEPTDDSIRMDLVRKSLRDWYSSSVRRLFELIAALLLRPDDTRLMESWAR